jgi:hypothetical protein
MTGSIQKRDELILTERINGRTLRQVGATFGLSVEGARLASDRAARRQVEDMLERIHEAQRTGDVFVVAVPADEDPRPVLAFIDWLLAEVDRRVGDTVRLSLHFRQTPTGAVAFGIEDSLYNPQEVAL